MFTDAMTVLQDLLDVQSRALMNADTELMRSTVHFPYRRITATDDMIIEKEDDMAASVKAFHQSISGMGVNHLIRLVTDAEYLSSDYIEGHHITHVMRNASAMLPAYENRVILRYVDDAWRLIEIRSALAGHGWPISMLRANSTKHLDAQRSPDDDVRRMSATPVALYQGFLDTLTRATRRRDFDAYLAQCELPYTSHINTVDTQMTTADDVRRFFDVMVALINNDDADDLNRTADHAQFLGSDLICGYHDTQFYKNGQPVRAPIKSRMILQRRGVQWKLKHVTNAIADTISPDTAPEPTEALSTHLEIQERTKTWPTLH